MILTHLSDFDRLTEGTMHVCHTGSRHTYNTNKQKRGYEVRAARRNLETKFKATR